MPRRRLIRFLFMLPLLLLSIVAWAWSGWHSCYVIHSDDDHSVGCGISSGTVYLASGRYGGDRGWKSHLYSLSPPRWLILHTNHTLLGFGLAYHSTDYPDTHMDMPFWFLIIVFSGVMAKNPPQVQSQNRLPHP